MYFSSLPGNVSSLHMCETTSFSKWLRCLPQERKIWGSNPACAGIFPGQVIPVTWKLALQWLPSKTSGITESLLGLVGLVSVYWVRWKVWSATSISVWQHVKLSEQIRSLDMLACCWNVKQPRKLHVCAIVRLVSMRSWKVSDSVISWIWKRLSNYIGCQ